MFGLAKSKGVDAIVDPRFISTHHISYVDLSRAIAAGEIDYWMTGGWIGCWPR